MGLQGSRVQIPPSRLRGRPWGRPRVIYTGKPSHFSRRGTMRVLPVVLVAAGIVACGSSNTQKTGAADSAPAAVPAPTTVPADTASAPVPVPAVADSPASQPAPAASAKPAKKT